MKKILTFSLLLICIQAFPQHRLTKENNTMRAGDEIIKQQVDYKEPGRSGENVLWDFGKLKLQKNAYNLIYAGDSDSLIVGTEHLTSYNYSLSGDSLLLWGYKNDMTLMKYEKPELLLNFPVNYGDSTFCYFAGDGRYGDRLRIEIAGSLSTKADAYGMMVLPNQDTLKNVIRVCTKKKSVQSSESLFFYEQRKDSIQKNISIAGIQYRLATDSVSMETETYRWYVKGYRYPIFETVKSIVNKKDTVHTFFDVAFFYPPQEHYYLINDKSNLAELFEGGEKTPGDGNPKPNPNPKEAFAYNFYPNPVQNLLMLEYYIVEAYTVEIGLYDTRGICLYNKVNRQNEGIYTESIDMTALPKGNYVLKIVAGDKNINEIILKK